MKIYGSSGNSWKLISLIFLNFLELIICQRNAYTSVESIKEVLELDGHVTDHLRHHLGQIDRYRASVLQYLEERQRMSGDLGSNSKNAQESMESMAANPLTAFQAIRRIAIDIPRMNAELTVLNRGFRETVLKKVSDGIPEYVISYKDDLVGGALTGVLRLQSIYRLPSHDLVQGRIRNLNTSAKLSIADCLMLADRAHSFKRLDLKVEWLEQAHQLCISGDHPIGQWPECARTTGPLLSTAIVQHDETKKFDSKEMEANETYYSEHSVLPEFAEEVPASEQRQKEDISVLLQNPMSYEALCYVGGRLMEPEEEAKLFCHFLETPGDVYTTLQRFQVEVQSIQPLISTIHNVLSSEEADFIQQLSMPYLHRSGVTEDGGKGRKYSENRISETAWIKDGFNPRIDTFTSRIQRITGLSAHGQDAEQLQVVNYGIGGMFAPHHDYLHTAEDMEKRMNDTKFMGNRLVTFIIYLSDVELGGSTSFPFARLAVRPLKGSATTWYNLKENGKPDFRTLHSGCPVLYGSKWIANKWILERGQLFRHPCPVNATN